ncbi:MAG: MFS transporter, partial [Deltaproteobacteria bacterium]|nr:MFS transporter [Deltaproteobacteria bacterium]
FATIIAGFCGGVAQSTPYIGHPAYKEMGGRAGYTLLTALFIGFGGVFGYISFIVGLIPEAAVMPILVFIGLEITVQAFQESPREHAPAVAFSFLPIVAYLVYIELAPFMSEAAAKGFSFSAEQTTLFIVTKILSGGFIITAMLWGAFAAALIDRNRFSAMIFLLISGFLALFGFIHSVSPEGGIYLPWNAASDTHYFIAASYGIVALLCLMLPREQNCRSGF